MHVMLSESTAVNIEKFPAREEWGWHGHGNGATS